MNYIKTFEASFLSRLKNPFKKSFEDGEIEAKKILLSLKGTNFGDVKEIRSGLEKRFYLDLKKSTIDSIISQSKHDIKDLKIYIIPHISNDTHTLDSIIIKSGFSLNGEYSRFSKNIRDSYSIVDETNWTEADGSKTKTWVCRIEKTFAVNKDEVSRKIEDFIDDISNIGGFKRLGVDVTIDSSLKSLNDKKKAKEFQKKVDEIKDCLYDMIDISYDYKIFPNKGGGISCLFDIEGISTEVGIEKATATLLNNRVIDILNSILEAEGRIKEIVPDCDIKMTFSTNKLFLTIQQKV